MVSLRINWLFSQKYLSISGRKFNKIISGKSEVLVRFKRIHQGMTTQEPAVTKEKQRHIINCLNLNENIPVLLMHCSREVLYLGPGVSTRCLSKD